VREAARLDQSTLELVAGESRTRKRKSARAREEKASALPAVAVLAPELKPVPKQRANGPTLRGKTAWRRHYIRGAKTLTRCACCAAEQ
jgi:hypothetical protein